MSGPLPYPWSTGKDKLGHVYFINHETKITTWDDPRLISKSNKTNKPTKSSSSTSKQKEQQKATPSPINPQRSNSSKAQEDLQFAKAELERIKEEVKELQALAEAAIFKAVASVSSQAGVDIVKKKHVERAKTLGDVGMYDDKIADELACKNQNIACMTYTEQFIDNPHYSFDVQGKAMMRHAWCLFNMRKIDMSLREYESATKLITGNMECWMEYLSVAINTKKYELAISCAQKMIEIEPNNTQGYVLIGVALNRAGYPEKSLEYSDKVATMVICGLAGPENYFPVLARASINRAESYLLLKKYEESSKWANDACSVFTAMRPRALAIFGSIFTDVGDYSTAMDYFRQYLASPDQMTNMERVAKDVAICEAKLAEIEQKKNGAPKAELITWGEWMMFTDSDLGTLPGKALGPYHAIEVHDLPMQYKDNQYKLVINGLIEQGLNILVTAADMTFEYLHNTKMELAFTTIMEKMASRMKDTNFQPKLESESLANERIQILATMKNIARQSASHSAGNGGLPIMRCYVAIPAKDINMVLSNGLAKYAKDEKGLYGKGIYLSSNAAYALRNHYKKPVCLLVCYVILANPYPVTIYDFKNKTLLGQNNYKNYGCNYVPIEQPTKKDFKPPVNVDREWRYDEIVIFQEEHILPRFLIRFGDKQPKINIIVGSNQKAISKGTLRVDGSANFNSISRSSGSDSSSGIQTTGTRRGAMSGNTPIRTSGSDTSNNDSLRLSPRSESSDSPPAYIPPSLSTSIAPPSYDNSLGDRTFIDNSRSTPSGNNTEAPPPMYPDLHGGQSDNNRSPPPEYNSNSRSDWNPSAPP